MYNTNTGSKWLAKCACGRRWCPAACRPNRRFCKHFWDARQPRTGTCVGAAAAAAADAATHSAAAAATAAAARGAIPGEATAHFRIVGPIAHSRGG